MTEDTKINTDSVPGSSPQLEAIISDISALKRDLAGLIRSLKFDVSGEVACAKNAVGHVGDEAAHIYDALAAQGERSVKAIGHQIEQQPVISLLLAFGVGYLGSRLLLRRPL